MNGRSRVGNARGPVSIGLAMLSFLLLGPQFVSRAATYYVDGNSPVARDTNPGPQEQPFRTISRATPGLRAGDTLLIKAGIYRETVVLSQSGTATAAVLSEKPGIHFSACRGNVDSGPAPLKNAVWAGMPPPAVTPVFHVPACVRIWARRSQNRTKCEEG